ncbi:NAD(P)-dependent oxidoreductase [Sphingomonas sp. AOB5]|uniref:NAD-dependent epimerase/dehydratase family protein n=1 Tax=Sphingomonas sp. AOB5 TaxID=3034017 RepID=UPI0023FA25D5|nr:NAD(P)-dependent oxidoreductase [Sphingomonas sp. AOB5]MDF7774850.1 NAD(P)-dependent oxidoreductase [Sphingomonas sp. AOB5]
MRCLVVGARGFVGVDLVRELLDRGHEVVALEIRGDMGRLTPYADRITWLTGDSSSIETLQKAIGPAGIDAIYYGPFFRSPAGSHDLTGEWATMGGGALNVFNLCRALPIKRIVFPSSTAVHGIQPADGVTLDETSRVQPFMIYGATKLLCEYFARQVNADLGEKRIVSVRLSAIYGPGADIASRGVNIFAVQGARGNPAQIDYAPGARVCVAHVADTARFLADLIEAERCEHDLYELGGLDVSFGDIADAVRAAVPGAELGFGNETEVPLPHNVSCARAASEFGLSHMPLIDGMRSVVDYERIRGERRRQTASQTA